MIKKVRTVLSITIALLVCFGALALAAPPAGKGKPPKGNQPVAATASFAGEILSNVDLQGELIDNGDFDTLAGQLANGETITVFGDAGGALEDLAAIILPGDIDAVQIDERMVTFFEASQLSWTIRLDRDRQPANRVQLRLRWDNDAGHEQHLRIGWVVQAYEGEKYPLDDADFGTSSSSSLESALVTFDNDLFRVDGRILTGRGKKTEVEVFSRYGEMSADASWCNMGVTSPSGPCLASTTIRTDLAN